MIIIANKEKKCAALFVKGVCLSTEIDLEPKKPGDPARTGPNPFSINPFWDKDEFLDEFKMNRLLGLDVSGQKANSLALDWAENGTTGEGEKYGRYILKSIWEGKKFKYTPFDSGTIFYNMDEMAAKFGKEFMIGGEEALKAAFDFYKELVWGDIADEMAKLIEEDASEALKELEEVKETLTNTRYESVKARINDRLKSVNEAVALKERKEMQAAVVQESAKRIAETIAPTTKDEEKPRRRGRFAKVINATQPTTV